MSPWFSMASKSSDSFALQVVGSGDLNDVKFSLGLEDDSYGAKLPPDEIHGMHGKFCTCTWCTHLHTTTG